MKTENDALSIIESIYGVKVCCAVSNLLEDSKSKSSLKPCEMTEIERRMSESYARLLKKLGDIPSGDMYVSFDSWSGLEVFFIDGDSIFCLSCTDAIKVSECFPSEPQEEKYLQLNKTSLKGFLKIDI